MNKWMNELYWLRCQVAEKSKEYNHISNIHRISFFTFFSNGKLVGNSHFLEYTTNEYRCSEYKYLFKYIELLMSSYSVL